MMCSEGIKVDKCASLGSWERLRIGCRLDIEVGFSVRATLVALMNYNVDRSAADCTGNGGTTTSVGYLNDLDDFLHSLTRVVHLSGENEAGVANSVLIQSALKPLTRRSTSRAVLGVPSPNSRRAANRAM